MLKDHLSQRRHYIALVLALISQFGCMNSPPAASSDPLTAPPELPMCGEKPCPAFKSPDRKRERNRGDKPAVTQPGLAPMQNAEKPKLSTQQTVSLASGTIKFQNNHTHLSLRIQKQLRKLVSLPEGQVLTSLVLAGGDSPKAQERLSQVQQYLAEQQLVAANLISISNTALPLQTPVEITVYGISPKAP